MFDCKMAKKTADTIRVLSAEAIQKAKSGHPEELRRAEHCTGCGRCSPHCPQSIDVPKEIAAIDAWIDTLVDSEIK